MNQAIVSIARLRTMSAAELVATARKFDRLSILETELLKRLDAFVQEEARKQERTLKFMGRTKDDQVQGIVDWARGKMEDRPMKPATEECMHIYDSIADNYFKETQRV